MLMVTLPTNFKVARFDDDKSTAILRQLEKDVDAARFDTPEGKIELPVKLQGARLRSSCRSPSGRCCSPATTAASPRTACARRRRRCTRDIETSRSVYNFVNDLCVKLGAKPEDLVPFEKYAAAAQSLVRPASAARALNNGVPNIERADKLVQLIARQKGLSHPVIDAHGGAGRLAAGGQPQEGGVRQHSRPNPAAVGACDTAPRPGAVHGVLFLLTRRVERHDGAQASRDELRNVD